MPGTRTTQNVGPILGALYPIDADLVSDEVNLTERHRNARSIVYKKPLGQGKFDTVVTDTEGNEHGVVVGATAAVAHASRHVVEAPPARMGVRGCLVAADARVRPTGACASVCGVAPPARQRRVNPSYFILHRVNE